MQNHVRGSWIGEEYHASGNAGTAEPIKRPVLDSAMEEAAATAAATTLQRQYRRYRDARERMLGLSLRRKEDVLNHVLWVWGIMERRTMDSGYLKPINAAEKHAILKDAREGKNGASVGGALWHGVLSSVASVAKDHTKTPNPLLLVQHQWLEAVDERHRYGAYLFEYYALWAASDTDESFFYWLDHGEGRTASCEKVSRERLEAAEVTYCNKKERQQYVVIVEDGKLYYANQSQKLVNSVEGAKTMFVMAPDLTLYMSEKKPAKFHHSSFLSGGAVFAAGYVKVEKGKLMEITPHSGHYRPSEEHFARCLNQLKDLGIDMSEVIVANPNSKFKEKNMTKLLENRAGQKKPSVKVSVAGKKDADEGQKGDDTPDLRPEDTPVP